MRTVRAGNMSTLNCPEEVHLAERLVQLHPWADMVKFARSGGEASAISIRIARAVTGRDHVAICGYHGWHDWYLSANLNNAKNLDSHLLPDLEPAGVPSALSGLVHPFEYNNFEQLSEIVRSAEIGVIKMEVERNIPPEEDFLKKVQNLANRKGIVLIFDECSSGFRETFGGLHKKYGLSPDIATFGKALGNGYAITAVLGKREVMEAAQRTFISSTFWTERIGPTAALQTLEVMERIRSWETITNTGNVSKMGWRLATEHKLSIDVRGLAAMPNFNFVSERNLEYKTLISQEMLKCGFLVETLRLCCTYP